MGDLLVTPQGNFIVCKLAGEGNRGSALLIQNLETLEFEIVKLAYGKYQDLGPERGVKLPGGVLNLEKEARILNAVLERKIDHVEQKKREPTSLRDSGFMLRGVIQPFAYGKPLDKLDKKTPPTLHEALLMTISACTELKKIHDAGYIHVDLKPDNLQWDKKTNKITLLDFGESMTIETAAQTKAKLGNLEYSAPEINFEKGMFFDDRHYSAQSDIYSMGKILTELLENCDSDSKMYQALNVLLAQMQSKKPEDRPTLESVLKQLSPLAEHLKQSPKERQATLDASGEFSPLRTSALGALDPVLETVPAPTVRGKMNLVLDELQKNAKMKAARGHPRSSATLPTGLQFSQSTRRRRHTIATTPPNRRKPKQP